MDQLAQAHALQQRLAGDGAAGAPLLALAGAADVLAEALSADLVAIYGVSDGASVLLAACGDDAALLPRRRPAGADAAWGFDGAAAAAAGLEQAPIGPLSAPLGALLARRRGAAGAGGPGAALMLHAAAAGLLRHLRTAQAEAMVALLADVHAAGDPLTAVARLLKGASQFVFASTNVRNSIRLALLDAAAPPAAGALLFEQPAGGGGGGGGAPAVSRMALDGTLLASALHKGQARFIKDLGSYMQGCPRIATDVFSRCSGPVGSIVALPLLGAAGGPLGGLYLAGEEPCAFENIQGVLLGLVNAVVLAFEGRMPEFVGAALLEEAARRREAASDSSDSGSSSAASGAAGSPRASDAAKTPETSSGGAASASASGSSRRLNTEAMMQVLQREVRKGWRRSQELQQAREVVTEHPIGRGGFGQVFAGRWHKAAAAIKVLAASGDERRAMQDATEMAVLSMVHHPNIVQLYAALTDMVQAGGPEGGGPGASYRRLRRDEDAPEGAAVCNLLVLELCDRGSLRAALAGGAFHRPLPAPGGGPPALGVDLGAALEVLVAVASALAHLHACRIVHGDVKAENVLLKTDRTRRLGFAPKLADFGLAKILSDDCAALNLDGAGTLTHLAPEMFVAGSRVTPAVDAYAFGMLIWEVYTRRRAFKGMSPAAVRGLAAGGGARPAFPLGAPAPLRELAAACWRLDPAARPAFPEIIARLEEMACAA
ncbi:MAG: kinase-like domain-containing protein [Monoraphidium minutum]|nr:MAG: kinase-like domain-containing protein [Monoraphidium minutum]